MLCTSSPPQALSKDIPICKKMARFILGFNFQNSSWYKITWVSSQMSGLEKELDTHTWTRYSSQLTIASTNCGLLKTVEQFPWSSNPRLQIITSISVISKIHSVRKMSRVAARTKGPRIQGRNENKQTHEHFTKWAIVFIMSR